MVPPPRFAPVLRADSPYRIRLGRPDDLAAVAQLMARCFPGPLSIGTWWPALWVQSIHDDLLRRARQPDLPQVWVIVTCPQPGGLPQVVAATELSQRPAGWQRVPQAHTYLANLAVDPAHRRRGLAQALLAACETETRQRRLTQIYLHVMAPNRPAAALYKRVGYRLHRPDPTLWDWMTGRPTRLLLVKSLNASPMP